MVLSIESQVREFCVIQGFTLGVKLTSHKVSSDNVFLFRTCLDMVTHQPASLQHSPQRKDFEGGVHLGIGGFNLVSWFADSSKFHMYFCQFI